MAIAAKWGCSVTSVVDQSVCGDSRRSGDPKESVYYSCVAEDIDKVDGSQTHGGVVIDARIHATILAMLNARISESEDDLSADVLSFFGPILGGADRFVRHAV